MSEAVFGQKRTRSQLTLPDDILHVPQGSPLKDARNAARSRNITRDNPNDSVSREEIEDELLLSPQKRVPVSAANSKRSASPPQQGEYPSTGDPPTTGRDLKRVKRDIFDSQSNKVPTTRRATTLRSARTHYRHFSGSSLQDTKRSSSELPSRKPHSTSNTTVPFSLPPFDVRTGRAQSVPLFPTSSKVLQLDLRNPPSSPTRMRSPSTEREAKLCIVPGRAVSSTLASILDDCPDAESPHASAIMDSNHCTEPPGLSATSIPIVVHLEPPKTPYNRSNLFTLPVSPLTPLPETPHPLNMKPLVSKHQTTTGETTDLLETAQATGLPPSSHPSIPSVTQNIPTGAHNLPEPSERRIHLVPAAASSSSIVPDIGIEMVRAKPPPVARNAFNILMTNAHNPKIVVGKGKGRATTLNHVGPKIGGSTFSRTQKTPMIEGSKSMRDNQKPSLKAKMKPREKPKPKPVPVSVVTTVELADGNDCIESRQQGNVPVFSQTEVPMMPSHRIESSEGLTTRTETELQTRYTEDDTQLSIPRPQPPSMLEAEGQAKAESSLNNAKPQRPIPSKGQSLTTAQSRIAQIPRRPKRIVAPPPPVNRVTRSASGRGKGKNIGGMIQANVNEIAVAYSSKQIISTAAASKADDHKPDNVFTDFSTSNSSLTDLTSDSSLRIEINPGSPMRIFSPAHPEKDTSPVPVKPVSASAVTPTTPKTPSKFRMRSKPMSSPSPTKLVRSSSMFTTRPIGLSTLPVASGGSSILSTLSNALEKLSMPPPPRPNTSMGFNRNLDGEDNDEGTTPITSGVKDDVSIGQHIFSSGPTGVKRAATLGNSSLGDRLADARKPGHIGRPVLAGTTRLRSGTGLVMQGGKFLVGNNDRSRIFGTGGLMGRSGGKVSKKSSLPSVMASPVKGGATADNAGMDIDPIDSGSTVDQPNIMTLVSTSSTSTPHNESDSKDKATRPSTWKRDVGRRISLATASLSRSLHPLPLNPPGSMGPPATPAGLGQTTTRSASGSYPFSARPAPGPPTITRAGVKTRSATSASKTDDGTIEHGPVKTNSVAVAQTLKILNECTIFVDVRSDDGEEAGSLFTEMLEGVGAKILTRVGTTCTHIVYKNGLMSTLNRYRLLQDPKPLVVGIGWVVECVEQRTRVDESRFLVDLDGVNVAGANKRRRSMLPKMIARDMTDVGSSDAEREPAYETHSLDGSSSSITLDDDLPPLEKARRRKSMLIGPRT